MLTTSLTAFAETLLAQGDRANASICLQAALAQNPADLTAHNLTEVHRLPGNFSDAFSINAVVSEYDDILRFFIHHPSSLNPWRDYLADGWRNMSELLQLMERLDRKLSHCHRFLEFACGFGRFTRHLKKILPEGTLHVADVVPGSVDFLKQQLGVQGFYSHTNPAEVNFEQNRYDTIFVLSLFSHLPQSTWAVWLARLFDALEPGGVLIFSTHGEKSAANDQIQIPDGGFVFFPQSESKALDGATYGCTYTAPHFVHQAIAQLKGVDKVLHVPGHFWGHQDAYALTRTL